MPMLLTRQRSPVVPDDLEVLDNGMAFTEGKDRLEYLWFHLREWEEGQEYDLWRVVCLGVLRYLPQEARQEPGLVERMRTVLAGLYNQRTARYDLAEIKAGVLNPPLGLLQMYGAIGIGDSLERARRNATLGMVAVRGAMANFEQSRLVPLTVRLAEWMRQMLAEAPHALVVIGQPEPRVGARGMGREGPGEKSREAEGAIFTEQQAEMFCRAMLAAGEEFLVLTLASRAAQSDLARMLAGVAAEASVPASLMTGVEAVSTGLALPVSLAENLVRSAAAAYGQTEGTAVSDGVAESHTVSHVEGRATTVGRAVTDGWAHTEGHATASGSSVMTSVVTAEGTAHMTGNAHTVGQAHTVGRAHMVGTARTSGGSTSITTALGSNWGQTRGMATTGGVARTTGSTHTEGLAHTEGSAHAAGGSRGTTTMSGYSVGASASYGGGVTIGGGAVPGSLSGRYELGMNATSSRATSSSMGTNWSTTDSIADTTSSADAVSSASTLSSAHTRSAAASVGGFLSTAVSSGSFRSATRSEATTISAAHTTSEADTTSQADTTSRVVSQGVSRGTFSSVTHSVADAVSHAETRSWARTTSIADGTSHGVTRSRGASRSSGTALGRSLGVMRGTGFGTAVVPTLALTRSYQWWNDQAVQLAHILRIQEELLRQATLEGAFLTDVYILTRTERGAAAAEAAVRQAFHGSGPLVVTPVQTRRLSGEEQQYIRLHAMAFTPSTREERIGEALEAYRDSTLLLPLQLAAYTAPVLFEEGLSVTTQERIPAFAFVPDMPGDVVLAHQWSTERAELTSAPLRLSRNRFFHTVFAADTGYGKTVAAERLVVETTRKWHYRTVVLDFGAGWRRLLNAPLGEPGRVEVWQLFPGAVVPFRWNPWQVGKRIQPERQLVATCEIFKNAGRMGERQLGMMRRAARALYLEHGVLTSDREVWADARWNKVRDGEEEAVINAARQERGLEERSLVGAHLEDLESFERQALAVHRSKKVEMAAWVERLAFFREMYEKRRDQSSLQSLEGVLLRLEVFIQGEMARMYGSGEGVVAVEDLGMLGPPDDSWGISILEGGAEMDEYAKAAILGLVAWHLYNDAVVRRRQNIGRGRPDPVLQIVFEEANKVLTGVGTTGGDNRDASRATTVELFQTMWRDGRKYRIFLHPVVQAVSELPGGILSSCNNGFFGQTKNPKDRDLIMAHLAFSEKGFTDEDYKRFISRMPAAMAVCKLGYSQEIVHTTPFLVRPIMVPAEEPTDGEILETMKVLRAAREWGRCG